MISYKTSLSILLLLILCACGESSDLQKIEKTYPDGTVQESYYVDASGRIQGEYQAFYENGLPYRRAEYKDSLKDGYSYQFSRNEELQLRMKYAKGQLVDSAEFFDYNGRMEKMEIRNSAGQLKYIKEFRNGNLQRFTACHLPSGKFVAWKSYNHFGNIVDDESCYLQVLYRDYVNARFVPHGPFMKNVDSAYIHVLPNMNYLNNEPIRAIRSAKYRNAENMQFEILDADYHDKYHVNLLVVTYSRVDGKTITQYFPVQGNKSRRVPKENLYPLN